MNEEKALAILTETNKKITQLKQVTQVVNFYLEGAPSKSCMDRIVEIVLETSDVNR